MLIKLALLKQQVKELANSLDCGGFVHLVLHVFYNNANLNASVQAQSSLHYGWMHNKSSDKGSQQVNQQTLSILLYYKKDV